MIGTVKMYDSTRRFGFVVAEAGGQSVFFHVSELDKAGFSGKPIEGDKLSFDIEIGPRGSRAVKIARA